MATRDGSHSRPAYRAYADVKYAYQNAGTLPHWAWYAAGAVALAIGVALVLRKR